MEDVIEVSHRPPDPAWPVVRVDEAGKQLVGDIRAPPPVRVGSPAKEDSEYERKGVANRFMAFEPLGGRRLVEVTDRRTAVDFARFLKRLLGEVYPNAERVVLVRDNLNTHCVGTGRASRRTGSSRPPTPAPSCESSTPPWPQTSCNKVLPHQKETGYASPPTRDRRRHAPPLPLLSLALGRALHGLLVAEDVFDVKHLDGDLKHDRQRGGDD